MKKTDIAGVGFFVFFLLMNVGYEYVHTIAETNKELFFGSVILIISHIGYVLCIKNLKWIEKRIKK